MTKFNSMYISYVACKLYKPLTTFNIWSEVVGFLRASHIFVQPIPCQGRSDWRWNYSRSQYSKFWIVSPNHRSWYGSFVPFPPPPNTPSIPKILKLSTALLLDRNAPWRHDRSHDLPSSPRASLIAWFVTNFQYLSLLLIMLNAATVPLHWKLTLFGRG